MAERKQGTQSPLQRKLFLLSDEIGLTRNERIEMSQYLLRRDVKTWANLTDEQILRLADALEGHLLIEELKRQRT